MLAALSEDEWQALADEARAESLIPLAHLVIEGLAPDMGALAARLDGRVVVDDVGRRCCTRIAARELFDEHEARQAEERERTARVESQRAEAAAQHRDIIRAERDRMKRIAELQQLNGGGLLREDGEL
ncbi:hypothetical protein [Mycolicibacterium frederiksbergense]|uniref:hypothetical protein n=1 Tax=Mycolicibacterium frederiksbergense TaxID=117567 RepID=UPI00265BD856|nr:hypothetical protein [Mycolicibacterium frederiksbergense]MDO0977183.1 hypothetical protein [Mycolicibacterium frederiksbergense]